MITKGKWKDKQRKWENTADEELRGSESRIKTNPRGLRAKRGGSGEDAAEPESESHWNGVKWDRADGGWRKAKELLLGFKGFMSLKQWNERPETPFRRR